MGGKKEDRGGSGEGYKVSGDLNLVVDVIFGGVCCDLWRVVCCCCCVCFDVGHVNALWHCVRADY